MGRDTKRMIRTTTKLSLNKETLRKLNNSQLIVVAGGDTPSWGNQQGRDLCSAAGMVCDTDDCLQ